MFQCLESLIPLARDPFRLSGLVWLAEGAFQGWRPLGLVPRPREGSAPGGAKRDDGDTNRAFIRVDSCPFAVPFCVRFYLVEKTRATVVEPDWFTAPTLMSYTWLDSNPFITKVVFLVR